MWIWNLEISEWHGGGVVVQRREGSGKRGLVNLKLGCDLLCTWAVKSPRIVAEEDCEPGLKVYIEWSELNKNEIRYITSNENGLL